MTATKLSSHLKKVVADHIRVLRVWYIGLWWFFTYIHLINRERRNEEHICNKCSITIWSLDSRYLHQRYFCTIYFEVKFSLYDWYYVGIKKCPLSSLAANNNVVDRNVNKFDKKSNKAHDSKSNCSCHRYLLKLLAIRFCTSLH